MVVPAAGGADEAVLVAGVVDEEAARGHAPDDRDLSVQVVQPPRIQSRLVHA